MLGQRLRHWRWNCRLRLLPIQSFGQASEYCSSARRGLINHLVSKILLCRFSLLLVLCLTKTCFEGSMYLFFLKTSSCGSHLSENAKNTIRNLFHYLSATFSSLSSFIITMIFVSLHALLTFRPSITTTIRIPLTPPGLHAKLSSLVYVISAFKLALVFSVTYENERAWLYNFYFFEACLVPRLRNSHLQRTSINGKVFYSYSIPNPR